MKSKIILLCLILILGYHHTKAQSTFQLEAGTHLILGSDGIKVLIDHNHLVLNGTLDAGNATVKMIGSSDQTLVSGGNSFYNLELEKSAGTKLVLQDSLIILHEFSFGAADNKVELGGHNVHFAEDAIINGFDVENYFITNGIGQVRKANLGPTPFTFPLGFNASSYNPVTISEFGVPDLIGLRCLEHAYDQGCLGSPYTSGVVDASWEVSEAIPGGMMLDIIVQWAASDELPNFDRSFSGNAHYGSNGWDLTVDECTAAAGSDPYTRERIGVSETGAFAVGNDSLAVAALVDLDLLMQGAYAGSGLMNDDLRAAGHLPTTEPFEGLGFTHHGFGGDETVAATVFDVTGDDAIIDWVLVEIRSGSDSTIIKATAPALLQKDGDIVGLDGVSAMSLPGIGVGDYYVVIKHRNHLGVMTAGKLSLSATTTEYDFTSNPLNSFGGSLGIADLGDGRFGLISGDFNHNGQVQNTDAVEMLPSLGNAGYLQGDLNMNSQVQNTDLQLHLLPNIGKGVQFPNN